MFPDLSGCDGDLQAAEDEAGPGGFRPRGHRGPAVLPGRLSEGLRSPDGASVSRHRGRERQIINAPVCHRVKISLIYIFHPVTI